MTMTLPENGTTAERDQAYRKLEADALQLLAGGAPVAVAAEMCGLSAATVLRLAAQDTAETPDVSPAPAAPALSALPDVEDLLRRAQRSTDRRVLTVAARIRHDLDLLGGLLANAAEVKAARRRVEALERRRAAIEEQLADAQGQLDAARGAAPDAPSNGTIRQKGRRSADPLAYSATVRAWLRENGYAPGSRGKLSDEQVAAYRAAHPEADAK